MANNQTPAFPGDYYYSSYSTTLLPPSFLPPASPVRRPIRNIPPYPELGLPPQPPPPPPPPPRQPRPTVSAPPPAPVSGPVAIPYPAPPTRPSSSPIPTFSPTADAPRIPAPVVIDAAGRRASYSAPNRPIPNVPRYPDFSIELPLPTPSTTFDVPPLPPPVTPPRSPREPRQYPLLSTPPTLPVSPHRNPHASRTPDLFQTQLSISPPLDPTLTPTPLPNPTPTLTPTPPPTPTPAAAAKPPDPESFFNFTAGDRLKPGTLAHSFANPGPIDLLFSAITAPFTYHAYKQMGASNTQALAGTVGSEVGGIGGGLAGARGGALLGAKFGPQAAIGGAIVGGLLGSQLGYRGGSKLADEASGLNEQFRQQQQAQYPEQMQAQALEQQQAQYTGQMQPPLPQLTQEEKIRQQVYAQAFNPYLPYMMQQMQLGGY